jgi:site-specific DNA-methyltransferase (adenine-specific)
MDWLSDDGRSSVLCGDVLERMEDIASESIQCCVTSPPYFGLRNYGADGQIGLEPSPEAYVAKMVQVFRGVRRVLRKDATLWLNLGDSYLAGKQLGGIPWRVAFALQSDGWILRQDCIWHKPSPMPSSVTDRCTTAHEFIFLLAKSERYYYDAEAIKEESKTAGKIGGFTGYQAKAVNRTPSGNQIPENGKSYVRPDTRNRRSVWKVSTKPYKGAHFATFPPDLIEPCILAGTSAEGCCSNCRAPLIRQTSKTKLKRSRPNAYTKRTHEEGTGNACANDVAGVAVETLGWAPSCDCAAEVMPCTVLDPFAGSGTTLQVARHHGRNGVGIELNPDYIELAKARIMQPLKIKKGK